MVLNLTTFYVVSPFAVEVFRGVHTNDETGSFVANVCYDSETLGSETHW